MTALPRVTWPSPPIATAPLRRTATMVVPWGSNPWWLSVMALLVVHEVTPGFSLRIPLRLPPSARMSFVVNTGEVLEIKVGINLGRGDVRVAEQLLHAPQISTGFKEMGGERMPEQ